MILLYADDMAMCSDTLGEYSGRRPLAVHHMSKCVKYWLKHIQLPVNRYPHVCYNLSRSYDDSGKITWATHVKMLLYKYGLGMLFIARFWCSKNVLIFFQTENLRLFCSGLAPRYYC